jgi:hypothetical protein
VSQAHDELHEVRIFGMPLALQRRAQEQHAELMREFALLDIVAPTSRHGEAVPQRLIQLIDDLNHRYSGIGTGPDAEREAAAAAGAQTVDLVYQVPESVAEACEALSALLDEADDFCREGVRLLTLAAPDDQVAFRRWYLLEFGRQVRGESPMSWPAYAALHRVVVREEHGAGLT